MFFKRLRQQNERLRTALSKQLLENERLKTQIKAYELANKAEFIEIYGSEMYQRSLLGSEYTKKWCEGQIQKEIGKYIMDNFGEKISYSNQIADDKHAMMTGKILIAVKEVE